MAIGSKGLGFLSRIGAKVVSQATQLGDRPQLDKLIGPVKVLLDAYAAGKLKAVYLSYTRFINTMRQEPVIEQLLPLTDEQMPMEDGKHGWDYIYEPEAKVVIDELLLRYVEALVYQAIAENMASEQAARMVAMKSATDNAGNVIAELQARSTTRRARPRSPKNSPRSSPVRRRSDDESLNPRNRTWLTCKPPPPRRARSSSASAPSSTWSSRATRCPGSTTR